MTPLPIDPALATVVEHLAAHRSLVLVAPPGAGKTTRVAPALLRSGLLSPEHPAIVLLQPRRVAARACARRIAAENGWTLGGEVGYHVRFERRWGPRTRLRVATEGVLARQLLDDPALPGVGAVILDEFHERSLHTDLAAALLKEIRDSIREDLLIIAMSATLDAEPIARFLGGSPVVRVEGRSHPVSIRHAPPPGKAGAEAVRQALADPHADGDILVFLPGVAEIRRVLRLLKDCDEAGGVTILPLHGRLSAEDQDRALAPASTRKVVLATNVAETSITIDGITTVIDTGLARSVWHDPGRGLDRLVLGRISRASADQRAGRAGRTAPGRCVRLWSLREHQALAERETPEIRRVDLAATVLMVGSWGYPDPGAFPWFEAPPDALLDAARVLLRLLGALDGQTGRITPLGRQLLGLPLHPRIGRLLLAAAGRGALADGAALAALLSEPDLNVLDLDPDDRRPSRAREPARGSSDLLVKLDQLATAERLRFGTALRGLGIDPNKARRVALVRDDLLRSAARVLRPAAARRGPPSEEDLLRLLLLAYPDRVVRRGAPGGATGLMVGGRGVRLDPGSVVRDARFFVALDVWEDRQGRSQETRVRLASRIELEWLEELFPDLLRREDAVVFDEVRQRVVGVRSIRYLDLPLREDPGVAVDPAEAGRVLAEALACDPDGFFRTDEAVQGWLARVEFLRQWVPEADLPRFGEAELAELLAAGCAGRTGVAELRGIPWVPILESRLTHSQRRLLDDQAPDSIALPNGRRARLTYASGRPPVLEARVQELLGWRQTPRLASGRVPLLLRILGPHFRPVQVTDDLHSFWTVTYPRVRKDLRGRYPKHPWPEDPLASGPAPGRGR